jgi:hypothetical protein
VLVIPPQEIAVAAVAVLVAHLALALTVLLDGLATQIEAVAVVELQTVAVLVTLPYQPRLAGLAGVLLGVLAALVLRLVALRARVQMVAVVVVVTRIHTANLLSVHLFSLKTAFMS